MMLKASQHGTVLFESETVGINEYVHVPDTDMTENCLKVG